MRFLMLVLSTFSTAHALEPAFVYYATRVPVVYGPAFVPGQTTLEDLSASGTGGLALAFQTVSAENRPAPYGRSWIDSDGRRPYSLNPFFGSRANEYIVISVVDLIGARAPRYADAQYGGMIPQVKPETRVEQLRGATILTEHGWDCPAAIIPSATFDRILRSQGSRSFSLRDAILEIAESPDAKLFDVARCVAMLDGRRY